LITKLFIGGNNSQHLLVFFIRLMAQMVMTTRLSLWRHFDINRTKLISFHCFRFIPIFLIGFKS